jgi:hypothetical protein
MFCENSLKWIVGAQYGVLHKFGINLKHKTHYLAVELQNYVNENIYAFTSCACPVGLPTSRNWDCWVSSLSTPIGLLIETTQLMFHTLKGKGKKIKRVVCKTWLCWNIIHSSSGVSRHQIYSLTRHSFHGCWHSQACGVKNHRKSLQKKPGWTESFDCVLMFFGTDI